ncbi:MAG: hypothetical protein WBC73_13380 [Phormidesmis sp.]
MTRFQLCQLRYGYLWLLYRLIGNAANLLCWALCLGCFGGYSKFTFLCSWVRHHEVNEGDASADWRCVNHESQYICDEIVD